MDSHDRKIFHFLTLVQSVSIIMLNIFGVIIIVGQKFIRITSNENQAQLRHKITLNQQLIIALYLSHIGLGTTRLITKTAPIFFMVFRVAQVIFSCLKIGFTVTVSIERFLTNRYPLNFEKNKKVYRSCYLIIPLKLSLRVNDRTDLIWIHILDYNMDLKFTGRSCDIHFKRRSVSYFSTT